MFLSPALLHIPFSLLRSNEIYHPVYSCHPKTPGTFTVRAQAEAGMPRRASLCLCSDSEHYSFSAAPASAAAAVSSLVVAFLTIFSASCSESFSNDSGSMSTGSCSS